MSLIIAIGNPQIIEKIKNKIDNPYITYPNIIDPSVDFWNRESVEMGEGNIVCPYCSFSINVKTGSFNIFNGDVSLRHDVLIGSYNAIMPGVRISGGVKIGNNNFFGLNSAVAQYKTLGSNLRIGAGSIVMEDLDNPNLYVGIPARLIK